MSWQNDAACRDESPELFYPTGATSQALIQTELAKAVCGRCAVQSLCLGWAILASISYGIWGGETEDERRYPRPRALGQPHQPPAQT